MGCDTSKTEAHEENDIQEADDDFTEYQIDSIKSTWPLLSRDRTSTGCSLFRLIFLTEPNIKRLFLKKREMHDEEILKSENFKEHIDKFMQTLEHVVDTLDTNRKETEQTLLLLGAKHAMVEGFKDEYFSVYSNCMLDTWESVIGEEFIAEVKESWEFLCVFMTRFMREGYLMYQQDAQDNEGENEAII